jgi:micrococcal nuclease|tara:strand:- start:1152 stop:1523 length:372 start_codon:yes stop_codon:yes gene_type:complete
MYRYKATLIKIVDGDTVDAMIDCGFSTFKKERIRLHGINAPESRTRDKEEKKRGLAAKARLKELIKEGKNEFIVETKIDKKGKFGRLLGTLYRDETPATDAPVSYNQMLINEGHAVAYGGGKR